MDESDEYLTCITNWHIGEIKHAYHFRHHVSIYCIQFRACKVVHK